MKKLLDHLMNTEPAIVLGALTALIAVAVGFGLPVSPAQVGLILAAVAGIYSVILRRIVTSPATAKVLLDERNMSGQEFQDLQKSLLKDPVDGAK